MEKPATIRLEEARKSFGAGGDAVEAVRGINLSIEAGETLCLIGPSGSGKTTVLKMINRLVEPDGGRILVGGEDIAEAEVIGLRRRIGYVVQGIGLFPHLDVAGNVGLLCEVEGWAAVRRRRRVAELLELVGLPAETYAARRPSELSGGQRQRVGIARALALDPPILLMDEPFGALDPITRDELHEEFLRLEGSLAKTIVLVTHDLDEAFHLGDRVALLARGELRQIGTEEDFRERPADDFVAAFVRSHAREGTRHV